MKFVIIHWIDICGHDAWTEIVDMKDRKPIPVKSCGWLVADEDTHKTIVQNLTQDGTPQGFHSVTIPAQNIIGEIEVYEEKATPSEVEKDDPHS